MKLKRRLLFLFTSIALFSFAILTSCKKETESGLSLVNTFTPATEQTESSITEGSGDELTISINFSTALEAGEVVFTLTEEVVDYATNYTTSPEAESGELVVPYEKGATSVDFKLSIIDDEVRNGNGKVTIAFKQVNSKEEFKPFTYSYVLTIIDDEKPQINPSANTLDVPSAVVGTTGKPIALSFDRINLTGEITIATSEGFTVSETEDGTFAATVKTSGNLVFVRYTAPIGAPLGDVTGTLSLKAKDVDEIIVNLKSKVFGEGTLYMAEYFATDVYNNSNHYIAVTDSWNGTALVESFPTDLLNVWTMNTKDRMAMKGVGLSVAGYPGPIDGTNVNSIISVKDQGNTILKNDCSTKSNRNTVLTRRFAQDGDIVSGSMFLSGLVKVENTPNNAQESAAYGFGKFITSGSAGVHIRSDNAGGFRFGVGKNVEGAFLSDVGVKYTKESYVLSETYVVILAYEFVEGDNNDVISLYVSKDESELKDIANLKPVVKYVTDEKPDLDPTGSGMKGFTHVWLREKADQSLPLNKFLLTGIRVASSLPALYKTEAINHSNPTELLRTAKSTGCGTPPGGWY